MYSFIIVKHIIMSNISWQRIGDGLYVQCESNLKFHSTVYTDLPVKNSLKQRLLGGGTLHVRHKIGIYDNLGALSSTRSGDHGAIVQRFDHVCELLCNQ